MKLKATIILNDSKHEGRSIEEIKSAFLEEFKNDPDFISLELEEVV